MDPRFPLLAAPAPSSGSAAAGPRGHHRHSETFLRFPDADLLLDPDSGLSFSGDGSSARTGLGTWSSLPPPAKDQMERQREGITSFGLYFLRLVYWSKQLERKWE